MPQKGPPGKNEGRAPHQDPAAAEIQGLPHPTSGIDCSCPGATAANDRRIFSRPATPKPLPRVCPTDVAAQLRARRAAANRLPALCDCCGAQDPLSCYCSTPQPPLTENAVAAWRAAIERTLPIGPPVVPVEVLQRLHRNGGADRELAERVWAETGGLVA